MDLGRDNHKFIYKTTLCRRTALGILRTGVGGERMGGSDRRLRRRLATAAALAMLIAGHAHGQPNTSQSTPPRKTLHLPGGKAADISGPVKPDWDSIRAHYTVPEWFRDAKFGIFIHWGLYSVPAAQSEWYPRYMYRTPATIARHTERFGAPDKFGYKDFIPRFKAEKYDPAAWADLFERAGAKYVVPVAEHHDGFAMYDSRLTRWDAKDMGPKRDLLSELMVETRKRGLKFGVSNHRIENWDFMYPGAGVKTDLFDPKYADFYGPPQPPQPREQMTSAEIMAGVGAPQSAAFREEWLARTYEQIDKFKPDLLWFDNGINPRGLDPTKLRLAAYYYNRAREWGKPVTLTTKRDAFLAGTIKDYERQWQAPFSLQQEPYQVDDALGDKWGYVEGMGNLSAQTVLFRLIENVSRNGNLLLNVSPMADGTIPEAQVKVLLEVGEWLKLNGEAIYGTRAWKQDNDHIVRFTRKGNILYAILLAWPEEPLMISAVPQNIGKATKVSLLGSGAALAFKQNDAGLTVTLPARPAGARYAYVLRLEGLKLDQAGH